MSSVNTRRWIAIAAVAVLTGCGDLIALIDRAPPSIVERDGLSYQVVVAESRYSYDTFEYRLRITNTSYGTVERWLPSDLAHPRVYREGRWLEPVWDPCGWGCRFDYGRENRVRLRRGEAIEGWGGQVRARDFARCHGGVYHLR